MQKPYFNLIVIVALLIGLLATVPTKVALADCVENAGGGDPSDIVCATDDADGVATQGNGTNENPDVVTVDPGITVESGGGDAIEGDEEMSVFNDGTVLGENGDGIDAGDDLINLVNTGYISGTWQGVDIEYDVEGVLDNSGTIISENSDAVRVGGDVSGNIFNSGSLFAEDNGIYVDDDVQDGGSIVNLVGGVIDVGYCGGCGANGISVDDDVRDGSAIINIGTIDAGHCGGCGANGITVDGDVDETSSIMNFGTIDAGHCGGCGANGITVDGDAFIYNAGVITAGNCGGCGGTGIDIGGDGIVFNDFSGSIVSTEDDGVYIDDYGVVVNFGTIFGEENGVRIDGQGAVFNYSSDTIEGYYGDGVDFDSAGYLYTSGTVISTYDAAVDGSWDDDFIHVGNTGVVLGGTSGAMTLWGGNDTVVLGDGGFSYGTSCGDIAVATVEQGSAPIVAGLMDAHWGSDTLVFNYFTPSQEEADAINADLASAGGTGTFYWNDQVYDIANFENVTIGGVFSEGATRLFDDGVVLAFANSGKIDVCSGEKGFRAGTVDMGALDNGQREFSAGNEGWFVRVTDLGGGQFEAHIFDGSGVEHFNDADGNGAADSTFVFSR